MLSISLCVVSDLIHVRSVTSFPCQFNFIFANAHTTTRKTQNYNFSPKIKINKIPGLEN